MFQVTAVGALVHGHVFHDTEDRHIDLLEHLQALLRIKQSDVLRSRHNDRARDRHRLRKRQLNITRTRGHIDHQIIELIPIGLHEQLLKCLSNQGTAPDHRFIGIDQEADRRDIQTVSRNRIHRLTVGRHGATHGAQHRGLARTVDISVQHTHLGAFGCQSQSDIGRNRALTDTALTRGNGDDVLHVGQHFKRTLHGVSDNLLFDFNRGFNARRLQSGLHIALDRLQHVSSRITQFNLDDFLLFIDLGHTGCHVVNAHPRVDHRLQCCEHTFFVTHREIPIYS